MAHTLVLILSGLEEVSVKGPFAHSALIPVAARLDLLVCGVPPQRGPPVASGKPNLLLLPESE